MTRVFDGHNDALLRIGSSSSSGTARFLGGDPGAHVDLPRATAEGSRFGGGFFAIWVPSPEDGPRIETESIDETGSPRTTAAMVPHAEALAYVEARIADVRSIESRSDGAFRIVTTAADVRDAIDGESRLAAVLHIEGAECVREDLSNLDALDALGVRSLGIVWSRPNVFAHGVPFGRGGHPDTGPGLTDAGRRLVRACDALGWLIDLSHLNERGFWDVAELGIPLVATHSAVHSICPTTRNLTDAQIEAIAKSGGVVGVNYHFRDLVIEATEADDVTTKDVVKHARYIADRWGVDAVALGSDFDGADPPGDLRHIGEIPNLLAALEAGGFSSDEIQKIARDNWLRVLDGCAARRREVAA